MTFQTLQRIHKALSDAQERANEALRYTEEAIARCNRKGMIATSTLLDTQKRSSNDYDELSRAIEDFESYDWHLRRCNMTDHSYEDAILEAQDGIFDKCHYCEYKGSTCRNQCMELEPIYNPNLR